ncbi:hypothetical protein [Anditalea andensis]|uniref:Uncharacterized protein n=1 Tax=Anditalea andensis TaxID=1048983 RepID=A0A074L6I9_9BACT|nr:hypothetical protein [Anditalea andensis]KEO75448.1 hypothetical protein EL17_00905 [Anditalea andensis]
MTYSDSDLQGIYEVLMKVHFHLIWTDLTNAILFNDDHYVKFYGLKNILGSNICGVGNRGIGVLFEGDINTIFNWCIDKKPLAPLRLAKLVPIYGENNSNYSEWHPYAKKLIDDFGYIKQVLSGLNVNMGTFSWTGSLVPLLEDQKSLFLTMQNHENQLISEWAIGNLNSLEMQIKQEQK